MLFLIASAFAGNPCDQYVMDQAKRPVHQIDQLVREQLKGLTIDEEMAIGQEALGEISKEYGKALDHDRKNEKYLRKLFSRILATRGEPRLPAYEIHYIEDETLNAFAIPGGHIFVYSGLMDYWAQNEAQLAVVIGHELGHIELEHPTGMLEYIESIPLMGRNIPALLLFLGRHAFSSQQELDSDTYGMALAHYSGYDAREGIALWENMAKAEAEANPPPPPAGPLGRILQELLSLGNTHPPPAMRACYNQQHYEALQQEFPIQYPMVGNRVYKKRRSWGPRW